LGRGPRRRWASGPIRGDDRRRRDGVKRQISKKTGAEYARLVLETSTAPPRRWCSPKPGPIERRDSGDRALLLTGSYSPRDRGEEQVPFIVEAVAAAGRSAAAAPSAWRWCGVRGRPPAPDAARAVAALCAAHPGPPRCSWNGATGTGRQRQQRHVRKPAYRVDAAEDLLRRCAASSVPTACTWSKRAKKVMATYTLDFDARSWSWSARSRS